MLTLARRLFWLAVLAGAGYAVYTAWQRRNEPMPDGPAQWPPFDDLPSRPAPLPDVGAVTTPAPLPDVEHPATPEPTSPSTAGAASPASPAPDWIEPTDGVCPAHHPIKGNASSGIYHVPGGRFYDRTVPERCYATEQAATADGYRRAKA